MIGILIPYRATDVRRNRNYDWCYARWRSFFPSADISIGFSPEGPFNRSAAINSARTKIMASISVCIVADADTHINRNAIMEAVRIADVPGGAWVLPYNRYYNLTDACSERVLSSNSALEVAEEGLDFEHRITSPPVQPYGDPVSGVVVMPSAAFDLLGGFDDRYVGWGYEDKDMALRLDKEWGPRERVDGFVFHLWHPVNGDPFQTEECKMNEKRFRAVQSSDS